MAVAAPGVRLALVVQAVTVAVAERAMALVVQAASEEEAAGALRPVLSRAVGTATPASSSSPI